MTEGMWVIGAVLGVVALLIYITQANATSAIENRKREEREEEDRRNRELHSAKQNQELVQQQNAAAIRQRAQAEMAEWQAKSFNVIQGVGERTRIMDFKVSSERDRSANGIRIRAEWESVEGASLVLYRNTGSLLKNEGLVQNDKDAQRLAQLQHGRSLNYFDAGLSVGTAYNYYIWVELAMPHRDYNLETGEVTPFILEKAFKFLSARQVLNPPETRKELYSRKRDEVEAEYGYVEGKQRLETLKGESGADAMSMEDIIRDIVTGGAEDEPLNETIDRILDENGIHDEADRDAMGHTILERLQSMGKIG